MVPLGFSWVGLFAPNLLQPMTSEAWLLILSECLLLMRPAYVYGNLRIVYGEALACDDSGIAQFNRIRYRSYDGTVSLYAFA